jgi:hypothetical protein
MEITKTTASLTAIGALIASSFAVVEWLDHRHESKGQAQLIGAALILSTESQNQATRNVYHRILEKCEKRKNTEAACSDARIEDVEAQLWRLDYDRQGIKALKYSILGVVPEGEE